MREPLKEIRLRGGEERGEVDGVDLGDDELEAAEEARVVVEAHALVVHVPHRELVHEQPRQGHQEVPDAAEYKVSVEYPYAE